MKIENLPESPEDFLGENHEKYVEELKKPETWRNVPLLNYIPLHMLKTDQYSLIRFRGMIQDMRDPEYFLKSYATESQAEGNNAGCEPKLNGMYRNLYVPFDGEEEQAQSRLIEMGTRRVFAVISIPAANTWVTDLERKYNTEIMEQLQSDRELTMETDSPATSSSNSDNEKEQQETLKKHIIRICKQSSPIKERPSQLCWIKVYEDTETLKLNSIIDVVGFYSLGLNHQDLIEGKITVNELDEENLDIIPSIHAIAVHQLQHMNPLLDQHYLTTIIVDNVSDVRKELLTLLKICVFDDELSAEFLLAHLISTIYNQYCTQNLGKFALNLVSYPYRENSPQYGCAFYSILEKLLVTSHFISLRLDLLNNVQLVPAKDYEKNRLMPAILQLAPQTHLVCDESELKTGELQAKGVDAFRCLANLIKFQQLEYDFHFYEIKYDVDIPVLILSQGRSILPSDVMVPLNISRTEDEISIQNRMKAADYYLKSNDRLNRFRRFITNCKIATISMDTNHMDVVQRDFVEMRKSNPKVNADDLHLLLVLSRLLAISHGWNSVNIESWNMAKDLNNKRLQLIEDVLPHAK